MATLEIRQLLSYISGVSETGIYGVGELAALGGVSRRTVRYYVQEGLLPSPEGLGRGAHYGEEHLQRLLRVKSLQEEGLTLDEVRRALRRPDRDSGRVAAASPSRAVITRVRLAPGLDLLVDGMLRLPPPGKLAELSDWCRKNFPSAGGEGEDDDSDISRDR
jgi:DNA-binding transcriptional MerR regulator